ncbi:MAG: choice-of-anchor A family protein [Glycomyces artemisiae]|uniref:Choice-of-anchor A family protein n=1 Tax=Glycomyces artemisiae TaxID=1076443 RepID=A0A850CBK1_9ACTN|nr:choice-of-anchor A family protein [Glycomyces artemisiae]
MHFRTRGRRARRFALTGAATLTAAAAATAIAFNAAGTAPTAQAATVTYDPLAPALDFNSFVENETTLVSTETEGPVATGGNLVVKGSYNVNIHEAGTFIAPGDAEQSGLVVGGRVDWTQDPATSVVQVHNYAKIGDLTGSEALNTDSNNASVNTHVVADGAGYNSTPRLELDTQEPLSSVESSPIDFDAAFRQLRSNARKLSTCFAHKVEMKNPQGATVAKGEVQSDERISITLEPGATNILNVTGEDLNDMSELVFTNQPTATMPLLINVDTSNTGGELDWDVANQPGAGGGNGAPYILWNFNDTSRLTLTGGDTVEGSILAPDADYTDLSASNVEGQIIAKNAVHGDIGFSGGEIHQFPFAAELACDTSEPSPDDITDVPSSGSPTSDAPTSGGPTTDSPSSGEPTSGSSTGDTGSPSGGTDTTTTDGGFSPLATTGSSLGPIAFGAVALILLGTGTVVAASMRRKRRES